MFYKQEFPDFCLKVTFFFKQTFKEFISIGLTHAPLYPPASGGKRGDALLQVSPVYGRTVSSLLLRSANERLHQGEALVNCCGKAAKQTLVCTPEHSVPNHDSLLDRSVKTRTSQPCRLRGTEGLRYGFCPEGAVGMRSLSEVKENSERIVSTLLNKRVSRTM